MCSLALQAVAADTAAEPEKARYQGGGGGPRMRGTLQGVAMIRTRILLGLYWGPPNTWNYR